MSFKKSGLKVNKSLGERSKFLLKSKKLGKSLECGLHREDKWIKIQI